MASKSKVKLYMFPGSNASLTGRLMLDHKGVEHKLVKLPPGMHAFIMLALGFETIGVPAIKWNGRRVRGTRSISRALDELVPERPLFPSDPERRKAVEEAERWGEELQNATRRIFYYATRQDRKAFRSVIAADRALPMRVFLRVGGRLIIRLASGAHRASDDAVREDVALLPDRLDQIDAWIDEGRLGGASLNAADYQIAVNVSALLDPDDLSPLVQGRPAAALARRVLPEHGGHVGPVLPAEWLAEHQATAEMTADPTANGAANGDAASERTAAFLRSVGISESSVVAPTIASRMRSRSRASRIGRPWGCHAVLDVMSVSHSTFRAAGDSPS